MRQIVAGWKLNDTTEVPAIGSRSSWAVELISLVLLSVQINLAKADEKLLFTESSSR
jgi:hypothetical protein